MLQYNHWFLMHGIGIKECVGPGILGQMHIRCRCLLGALKTLCHKKSKQIVSLL